MRTLRDIGFLEGVKVLVRADFNVPVANDVVADDFRIRMALPTIDFLRQRGAKVILVSHIEASDGTRDKNSSFRVSLKSVAGCLQKLGEPVIFVKDVREANDIVNNRLKNGECALLENLRCFEGEEANDKKFSKELASLGDIFVNEAFSVSHREHASIIGLPKFLPSYAGLQFEKEVANLTSALNPSHPCVFILGGAKFDTKLPLIEKFLKIADTIFIGGALANDALKALGKPVGASKISTGAVNISHIVSQPNIIVPVDAITQDHSVKNIDNIAENDRILDAGPKTLELLKEKISGSKFILWNGPLGLYEDGFQEGTLDLAKVIAAATVGGARSIVGGGDTLAAISSLGLQEKFTFISTGGGAMLEFLAKGTLVGILAMENGEN